MNETIKPDIVQWLLDSNPWTKYKTLTDILNKTMDDIEVLNAYDELLNNSLIKQLIKETSDWFPESITRHNDPKLSYYKLRMLADFGLSMNDKKIKNIIEKAASHFENNLFTIREELPEKEFKKPDKFSDEWHALPCDSPLLTYTFLKLGLESENLNKSINEIKNRWNTSQGWFCHFFFVEGQYKKLQIGCPMAGLQALEIFSLIPSLKESEYAKNAFAPLKYHYESGKSLYYFGRSKKFWTFKYPYIWYNALYLADVFSRFDFLKKEKLVSEIIQWIEGSKGEDGKFKATSIFMPYKQWDFGNKKETSPWITFLCYRILNRYHS